MTYSFGFRAFGCGFDLNLAFNRGFRFNFRLWLSVVSVDLALVVSLGLFVRLYQCVSVTLDARLYMTVLSVNSVLLFHYVTISLTLDFYVTVWTLDVISV